MSSDMIISEAIEYVNKLFAGNSDGHGADHIMRVYHNAQILMEAYPEADGFAYVKSLSEKTGIKIPDGLKDLDKKQILHSEIIEKDALKNAVDRSLK